MCDNTIITPGEIDPRTKIIIGVWDTLNVRSVEFDVSAWVSDYGVGTLQIIHQRQGDDLPYLVQGVAFDPDTGLAVWTFDEIDSAVVGAGAAALVYIVGDEYIARTPGIPTYTGETIGMSGATPPDPWEAWYTQVLEASAAAQEAAETAIHQPVIGNNGNWWTWDADTSAYVDTGEEAQGPQGEQGEQGEQGIPGVSPTAYVTQDEDGATITVIDGSGTTTAKILNGEVTAAQLAAVQAQALAACATDNASGRPAILDDGADGVPIKSLSVTPGDYAVEPNLYIEGGTGKALLYAAATPRCIVFPCVGGTTYTVNSGLTATMRIASYTDYPKNGDTPTDHDNRPGVNTISLETGSNDKWVMVQFFADGDSPTITSMATALGTGFGISPTPVWTEMPVKRVGKNLVDLSAGLYAGRWDTDGTLNNDAPARQHTLLFPVTGGTKYVWSTSAGVSGALHMAWFDSTLGWIGYSTLSSGNASAVVDAPANAAFASLSVQTSTVWVQFERGSAATAYTAFSGQTATLDLTDGTLDGTLTTTYGNNDFTAPAGTLTVIYRADTSLYIEKKIGG